MRHLLPGQTYDLTARLGTLLVVAGYAMPEMRQAERVQRGARGAVQRRARRGRTTIRRK